MAEDSKGFQVIPLPTGTFPTIIYLAVRTTPGRETGGNVGLDQGQLIAKPQFRECADGRDAHGGESASEDSSAGAAIDRV